MLLVREGNIFVVLNGSSVIIFETKSIRVQVSTTLLAIIFRVCSHALVHVVASGVLCFLARGVWSSCEWDQLSCTLLLARARVDCLTMAEELEELWKKLMVTDEEDEDIVLGSNSTRVAKEVGKTAL
nr:hypothetical protein CFP56_29167 [Quercus suber]